MKTQDSSDKRGGDGPTRRRSRGFTLTELMVVIVIIVILAALSFMGVTKMKAKARSAVCMSNLRQVGMAMITYSAENKNKLPPLAKIDPRTGKQAGIWTLVLARAGYLWDTPNQGPPPCGVGVWTCPECDFASDAYGGFGIAEGTVMAYDDRMSRANSRMGRKEFGSLRLASIRNPSRTWLVGDAAKSAGKPEEGWYAVWAKPSKWRSGHFPAERHGGKANVCMVDGHVESLNQRQIEEGNFTLDRQ